MNEAIETPALQAACEGIMSMNDCAAIGANRHRRQTRAFATSAAIFAIGSTFFLSPLLGCSDGNSSTRRSLCLTQLRQIGMALETYQEQFGAYPPAVTRDSSGKPLHSWRILLLPFFGDPDLDSLYQKYRLDEPWNSAHNQTLATRAPSVYVCPEDRASGNTSYVAVVGAETIWPPDRTVSLRDVLFGDGPGNTVALVEVHDSGITWTEPRDVEFAALNKLPGGRLGSRHSGGFCVLVCDLRCLFLSDTTTSEQLRALLTRSGKETLDPTSLARAPGS